MATAMPYPGPDSDNLTCVPSPLRARPQWVLWRAEERQTAKGPALTKVPYNAHGLTGASTTDPLTWSTYEYCVKVLAQTLEEWAFLYGEEYYGGGIGYVLTEDDPFVGIDLDHCIDPTTGEVAQWATAIVHAINSYTEVTPSQTGLRIFGVGTLPPGGRKKGDIEMYTTARFLTVTGWHQEDTPDDILPRQGAIDDLWLSLWGVRVGDAVMVRNASGEVINQGVPWTILEVTRNAEDRPCARFADQADLWPLVQCGLAPAPAPHGAVTPFTDEEVIQRACKSAAGEKITRLAAGDWQRPLEGSPKFPYASASDADAALIWELSFWTRDAEQIERLMRLSKLVRPKWDAKRGDTTWLRADISKALQEQTTYYTAFGAITVTTVPMAMPTSGGGPWQEAPAPAPTATAWEQAAQPAVPVPVVTDLADMLERDYPLPTWLIDDLIPAGLVFFVGSPKSSKTYLAYSLALSLAVESERGGLWLGQYPILNPGPVVYLSLEDDEADSRYRIAELAPQLLSIPRDRFLFIHGQDVPSFDQGLVPMLKEHVIPRYHPALIVIDPISYLASVQRKSTDQFTETKNMLFPLRLLGREARCTIVGVDHRRKKSNDDVDIFETMQGSQAKGAVNDAMLVIVRDNTDITVHVKGRRNSEQTLTLSLEFDEARTATWHYKGSSKGLLNPGQYGDLRMRVILLLSHATRPLALDDIMLELNILHGIPDTKQNRSTIRQLLYRAKRDREVETTDRGKYVYVGTSRDSDTAL